MKVSIFRSKILFLSLFMLNFQQVLPMAHEQDQTQMAIEAAQEVTQKEQAAYQAEIEAMANKLSEQDREAFQSCTAKLQALLATIDLDNFPKIQCMILYPIVEQGLKDQSQHKEIFQQLLCGMLSLFSPPQLRVVLNQLYEHKRNGNPLIGVKDALIEVKALVGTPSRQPDAVQKMADVELLFNQALVGIKSKTTDITTIENGIARITKMIKDKKKVIQRDIEDLIRKLQGCIATFVVNPSSQISSLEEQALRLLKESALVVSKNGSQELLNRLDHLYKNGAGLFDLDVARMLAAALAQSLDNNVFDGDVLKAAQHLKNITDALIHKLSIDEKIEQAMREKQRVIANLVNDVQDAEKVYVAMSKEHAEILKKSEQLKQQATEQIVSTVVYAQKDEFELLYKKFETLIKTFLDKQTADKYQLSTDEREAYGTLASRLQDIHNALKMFNDYFMCAEKGDWKASRVFATTISWASQAYSIFHQLFQEDNKDQASLVNAKVFTGIKWAFRAANLTSSYAQEVYMMSRERVEPTILASPATTGYPLPQFVRCFTQEAPIGEALQELLYADDKGQAMQQLAMKWQLLPQTYGLRKVALVKSLFNSGTGAAKATDIGKNITGKLPLLGNSSGIFDEIVHRGLQMVVTSLYYHKLRQYFFASGSAEGWSTHSNWKKVGKGCIDATTGMVGSKLKDLVKETFLLGRQEQVQQWTLGVISPELISLAVSVGTDLTLTSPQVKPWIDKVIKLDISDVYQGSWHKKVKEKHPTITDGTIRALGTEQAVVSHIARQVGGSLGTTFAKKVLVKPVVALTQKVLQMAGALRSEAPTESSTEASTLESTAKDMLNNMFKGKKQEVRHEMQRATADNKIEVAALKLLLKELTENYIQIAEADQREVLSLYHESHNIDQVLDKIVSLGFTHVVGSLGGVVGSYTATSGAYRWWESRIVVSGKPMVIPSYYFNT